MNLFFVQHRDHWDCSLPALLKVRAALLIFSLKVYDEMDDEGSIHAPHFRRIRRFRTRPLAARLNYGFPQFDQSHARGLDQP